MNLTQIKILLNQLFDCSCAIYKAIANNDSQEIDRLIITKDEKLKLFQENKKFIDNLVQFNDIIDKIKQQEAKNLKLLTEKKEKILKEQKTNLANIMVLKKYEQNNNLNGSIVDIKE